MRKAVFFDRDGVLNRALMRDSKPHSPSHLDELEIIPGAREALESLRSAGYLLIVATNQPNVARGVQAKEAIERMHERLGVLLPLDDIRVCFHDDPDHCSCRKPMPGLLLEAARYWGIRLSESYMIGDRRKDIEAGHRAGCKTILLRYPHNENESKSADYCSNTLLEAVHWILDGRGNRARLRGNPVRRRVYSSRDDG
jgi:D-glycero-D-manno-heptose 1,7-bisphosphate phosphatase